jgi:hypothetical protein
MWAAVIFFWQTGRRSIANVSNNFLPPELAPALALDRRIARYCVAISALAQAAIFTIPSVVAIFYTFSYLGAVSSAARPALLSLGVICLHAADRTEEVQSLFGAMAALSSVTHWISVCFFPCIHGTVIDIAYLPSDSQNCTACCTNKQRRNFLREFLVLPLFAS